VLTHLVAVLPGASADRIVLVAPYDSGSYDGYSFVGANDGASGAALLLEMARVLAGRSLPYTVELVWLEGEGRLGHGGGDERELRWLGSRGLAERWAANGHLAGIRLLVSFNRVCDAELHVARDSGSHREFRESFWRAAHRLGLGDAFSPSRGYESVASSQVAFRERGVRQVVAIEDTAFGGDEAPGRYAGKGDVIAHCSRESLTAVGRVAVEAVGSISAQLAKIDRFARMPSAEPEAKKPTPEAPLEPEGESTAPPAPAGENAAEASAPGEPSPRPPMRRAASSLRGAAVAFAALVALGAIARADGARTPEPVKILVESPHAGEVVKNQVHQAPIRGTAVAFGERPIDFDIMLVIDVSGSTKNASGSDVDRDGQTGFNPQVAGSAPGAYPPGTLSTDPDDSILAAEVRAADALVASLTPNGRTRVGVISFSGEMNPRTGYRVRYDQQDAWLEVPLTADFGAVRARLPEILRRGPDGGTNFAAGIRLAITELAGLSGCAQQRARGRAQARAVPLRRTSHLPRRTRLGLDPGDVEAALAAANVAHSAGIAINTYALGPSALTNPFAATEVSRITLGTFLRCRTRVTSCRFSRAPRSRTSRTWCSPISPRKRCPPT
jgi:hypothetical protein